MSRQERSFTFALHGEQLVAVLAEPSLPVEHDVGVLVVVGGPQYRAGSHRQFVLLARALAQAGFPTMRFDFRGMGDSSGAMRAFTEVDEDIAAAIAAFRAACPNVQRIVLWGLCDGATAAGFYMPADPRVAGAILLNPWVRSASGEAQTMLKHYYLQRVLSADFWRKLLGGRLNPRRALAGLWEMVRRTRAKEANAAAGMADDLRSGPLEQSLPRCLQRADRPLLLLLSGQDFVAAEFEAAMRHNTEWQAWSASRVTTQRLAEANHTFSSAAWRGAVETHSISWLRSTLCALSQAA